MSIVCEGIAKDFVGVKALKGVDLSLEPAAILGLIGPNGSGKTTLLNCISGVLRPTRGSVHIEGTDCTGWTPQKIAAAGVSRSFQNVRLFPNLTAQENVEVGVASAIGWRRVNGNRAVLARGLLREVGAEGLERRAATTLPQGIQRKIEIARALATQARYIFLDEPAAGLNEAESDELLDLIASLRQERGCGLLVVDHDLRLIMRLCDSVHVLHEGSTLAVGSPVEVRTNPAVIEAYLGRTDAQVRSRATPGDPT